MIISILNQFNMIDNNLFFEQKRNPFYYKLIVFSPVSDIILYMELIVNEII